MPKIKNWTRQTKNKRQTVWVYDGPGRGEVFVEPRAGQWAVYTQKGTASTPNRRTVKKTREDAEEWAVNWMKKNTEI